MRNDRWLYWLFFLVLLPALLINLGLMPFIDDEGIRSLVGLEMSWSNNYITPTLHGSYYYNKPPLWNWILLVSFSLFGEASELAARIPSVLALLGFTTTVYFFSRKHYDRPWSFLHALVFLTCGRMLFWESLLGLIDIFFSWIMYTLIMVIFHEGEQKRWWRLFLLSYTLMAVGFLLKGLPAIVFQGITVLTYLIYRRQWKRLFSIPHIISGLLGVLIIASYYLVYNQYNSLSNVFTTLVSESGKRTAAAYSLWDTLGHMANFPLELFYHFLPWTIFAVFLFRKGIRQRFRSQPYLLFCGLAFITNILIYWISPNFYPRYVLMILPLLFTILLEAYRWHQEDQTKLYRGVQFFYGVVLSGVALAWLVPLFIARTQVVPGYIWKSILISGLLLLLSWQYWQNQQRRMWIFALSLLVIRIGFNWFVLPDRLANDFGETVRQETIAFSERWADRDLAIFHETHLQATNSFYLEQPINRIIPRDTTFIKGKNYIFNPVQYDSALFLPLIDSFPVRHGDRKVYYVGKLNSDDAVIIEANTLTAPPTH